MANFNFKDNNYSGELLEDLLVYTSQENETYKEGLIHVHAGIQHSYNIPLVQMGKIIQDHEATPSSDQSKNDTGKMNFTERKLEPNDFMVYFEFNPREFEKYYRPFQPEGNLVFRTLNPSIQAQMIHLLMANKNEYIDYAIWNSVKGGKEASKVTTPTGEDYYDLGEEHEAGPVKYFDGLIKRMLDNVAGRDGDKDDKRVILAGNATFADGEAVQKALRDIWRKAPGKIRKKSNVLFLMDMNSWDLYDEYLTDKQFKYKDNTSINEYRFKGKRIVALNALPKDTIIFGQFTSDRDSNAWMGVDYANDENVFIVDRLQANSELYFVKMLLKMDVNIVRPGEIVLWTPYQITKEG